VRAIEALGEALAGSGRPLVVTSGTALIAPGRVVTEDDVPAAGSFNALAPAEATALSFAGRGVRVSVVRCPLTVHGEGDHGFIPAIIGIARDKGVSADGHFGWMAPFALLDSPASSAVTQKRFGWLPEHPGLIADLDEGHYFTS
jgi:nucleoside-diphosphate-sugar epimerase